MASLGEVNVRIGADIRRLQQGLNKAQRAVERSARRMTQIGKGLTSTLTLPLVAASAASIKFATDFETSFTKINTLVGITGPILDDFKEGIRDISEEVGKSQVELSDALFVITSAGQRGADAMDTLSAASKASAVGLGQTAEVARAAVSVVQAYGAENIKSADAVDKLTAIVREGNLAAEELAPSLGRVLPIASSLGVSFDEVGANIAVFTRLGVSASEAVTGLTSLLSSIAKPSEKAAERLASVGLSMDDVRRSIKDKGLADTLIDLKNIVGDNTEALSDIFGNIRALTNVLGTAGAQADNYRKVLDSIANSTGIVDEGFKTVSQTSEAKMQAALVSLQNVAIDLGAVIVPAFTDLLSLVTPLIKGLSLLPAPVKTAGIAFAGMAAATGPILTLWGNMQLILGSVRVAFQSVTKAVEISKTTFAAYRETAAAAGLSVTKLTGVIPALTAAWRTLNTVAKASIIGLAATAIAGLVAVISSLNKEMSDSEKIQRSLNSVRDQAASSVAGERAEVEALAKVIKDSNEKYEVREAALKRLQEISPEYFSGLTLEKESYEKLNTQVEKYVENIIASARAQAARQKIVDLEQRRLELQQQINDELTQEVTLGTAAKEAFNKIVGNDFITRIQNARKEIELIEKQQESLANTFIKTSAQIDSTTPVRVRKPAFGGAGPSGRGISVAGFLPATQDIRDAAVAVAKELQDSLNTALPQVSVTEKIDIDPLTLLGEQLDIIDSKAQVFGESFDPVAEKIKLVENAMKSLLENGVSPYSASIEFLKEQHAQLQETYNANAEALQRQQATMEAFGEAGQVIGDAIVNTTNRASISLKELGNAALSAARKFVAAKIREFVAAQLVKAGSLGPFGLLLAPAIGAAAAAAFNGIIASLKIPAFAHGGLLTGPAVILAGEGPGTSANNPEVIAPLDKLKGLLGSQVQEVVVTGRLAGQDILISNERTAQRRARMRGF